MYGQLYVVRVVVRMSKGNGLFVGGYGGINLYRLFIRKVFYVFWIIPENQLMADLSAFPKNKR